MARIMNHLNQAENALSRKNDWEILCSGTLKAECQLTYITCHTDVPDIPLDARLMSMTHQDLLKLQREDHQTGF